MGNIHNVNTQMDKLVKSGSFIGIINSGLKQNQRWCQNVDMRKVPVRDGSDFWINESESASPIQDPVTPVNVESRTVESVYYNDIDMRYQKYGKFPIYMNKWKDGTEALVDDLAVTFADTMKEKMDWVSDSANLTRDLQCRRVQTQGYLGGNTYSTTVSAVALNTINVKDTNGFREVTENGIIFPVSADHPLPVTITNANTGPVQVNVIGFTTGTRNNDDDTIPGTLTLSANIDEIALGDQILSSQAPPHIAPNGKSTPYDIESTDIINLNLVMDTLAVLQSYGVKPPPGGLFKFVGDTQHQAQFWRDSAFREGYRGNYGAAPLKDGARVVVGGIEFDFSHQPAKSTNENGYTVRRGTILADGALIQGYYEKDPSQTYNVTDSIYNKSFDAKSKIHYTIKKPTDIDGERYAITWKAYWGFALRRDSLSNFGRNKLSPLKRGVGVFTG